MRKTTWFVCLLLVTALALSGCAREQTVYQEVGLPNLAQPTEVRQADIFTVTDPPEVAVVLPDDYYEDAPAAVSQPAANAGYRADTLTTSNSFAGSTPIPLDPVDMPTPTPRPDIVFEYEEYKIAMGYTFEAPSGWEITQNDGTTFILTDPETRDGVNGQIILTISQVDSGYKINQVKSELTNQLNDRKRNYVEWRIWTADSRKLMDNDGYYNTYRGVSYDGTIVRGLIHIALSGRRLIRLEFVAPGWYNNSYTRVYNRVKNTMK